MLTAIIYVVRNGGPYFYFYVWAFLCIMSIILMTIYPTVIAPLFNTYTPLQNGELYEQIAKLAEKVQFPLTKIFVVDGSKRSAHSNAYFYGFFKVEIIIILIQYMYVYVCTYIYILAYLMMYIHNNVFVN